MLRTGRAEKVDEKNGVICLVSMFPSWVTVFKLSKKVFFAILCWAQQETKFVKAIHIYESESLYYSLYFRKWYSL